MIKTYKKYKKQKPQKPNKKKTQCLIKTNEKVQNYKINLNIFLGTALHIS